MGKEAFGYAQESGETGFLAGILDVYADRMDSFCDWNHALDMDIFHVPDNDISLLNDAVRKRLLFYHEHIGGDHVTEDEINHLDFRLKRREIKGEFRSFFAGESGDHMPRRDEKTLDEINRDLARTLELHIGKPLCIYEPERTDDALPILGDMYLGNGFYYYFVGYQDYAILFIFGSGE